MFSDDHILGILLWILQVSKCLILTKTLWERCYFYHPYSKDEGPETMRSLFTQSHMTKKWLYWILVSVVQSLSSSHSTVIFSWFYEVVSTGNSGYFYILFLFINNNNPFHHYHVLNLTKLFHTKLVFSDNPMRQQDEKTLMYPFHRERN